MFGKPKNIPDETVEHDALGLDETVVELVIDGVLDLHGFQPKEVKDLVPDYLVECRDRDILEVRIIHGKGTGVLRRIVHAALDRLDIVAAYHLGDPGRGSWGATLVSLKAKEAP